VKHCTSDTLLWELRGWYSSSLWLMSLNCWLRSVIGLIARLRFSKVLLLAGVGRLEGAVLAGRRVRAGRKRPLLRLLLGGGAGCLHLRAKRRPCG